MLRARFWIVAVGFLFATQLLFAKQDGCAIELKKGYRATRILPSIMRKIAQLVLSIIKEIVLVSPSKLENILGNATKHLRQVESQDLNMMFSTLLVLKVKKSLLLT